MSLSFSISKMECPHPSELLEVFRHYSTLYIFMHRVEGVLDHFGFPFWIPLEANPDKDKRKSLGLATQETLVGIEKGDKEGRNQLSVR